jgi:hypothetical protein
LEVYAEAAEMRASEAVGVVESQVEALSEAELLLDAVPESPGG